MATGPSHTLARYGRYSAPKDDGPIAEFGHVNQTLADCPGWCASDDAVQVWCLAIRRAAPRRRYGVVDRAVGLTRARRPSLARSRAQRCSIRAALLSGYAIRCGYDAASSRCALFFAYDLSKHLQTDTAYHVLPATGTWYEMRAACTAWDAASILAVPTSQTEMAAVRAALRASTHGDVAHWVGYSLPAGADTYDESLYVGEDGHTMQAS